MKFNEFALSDPILQALEKMGFEEATEIQEKALPLLLEQGQEDFIGLAQTGTGKNRGLRPPHYTESPRRSGSSGGPDSQPHPGALPADQRGDGALRRRAAGDPHYPGVRRARISEPRFHQSEGAARSWWPPPAGWRT
jgi:hypothetical protein